MDRSKDAASLFDKRAGEYEERYMDVSLYHDTFDFFCDHIPDENATVLEVACGPGNITQYLLSRRPGFRVLGIDLSPNMIRLAEKNNPQGIFEIMDARDIGKTAWQFNAVMCGFGLPYLSREEAVSLIADVAVLLKSRGVLYLSTMEGAYSQSGFQYSSSGEQLYIYYHEAGYLTDALVANGFNIIHEQRKTYPGKDESIVTDLILIAVIDSYQNKETTL
ncbi:MAG TPA: class I SAM-dependent methyltransferase [Chitinophaga sp.]|uniref:class I SAM-dependent DNA methyltransferase n=1 Tax=Chitinophaga sp. TaxID=1869181 RepID=UPI002CEEB8B4|nr:class I SAM-dependent methyltransferase [Chitinophaga sp.]HVI43212.1 class I SAM-dependent methyltransferase [Chitinophaga sp.]